MDKEHKMIYILNVCSALCIHFQTLPTSNRHKQYQQIQIDIYKKNSQVKF